MHLFSRRSLRVQKPYLVTLSVHPSVCNLESVTNSLSDFFNIRYKGFFFLQKAVQHA